MANIKKISNIEEYNEFTKNNEKVVIKFSANWCAPCKLLSETISKLDESKLNGYLFGEVDVDEDFADELNSRFNISSVPVMVLFNNGEPLDKKIVGYKTSTDIYNELS